MSSDQIIKVENISKHFAPLGYRPKLRHDAMQLVKRWVGLIDQASWETNAFWALKDVSFTVGRGEGVGIIGRNGAGKSTLLRIISGIMEPTKGNVEVNGRFTTLIGLGAGFDKQRTGRENIYLNSAIFGFMPKQVDEVMDQIIEFSELGEFLDRPVKYYSSGMVARLGFSIAIHILPDIIILDEVLSVGDAAFKRKCVARIRQFREDNSTFLLVSHSPSAIRMLCDRAIWLDRGELLMDGNVKEVLAAYNDKYKGQPKPGEIAPAEEAEEIEEEVDF